MKTIENKKIVVNLAQTDWLDYVAMYNGNEINARGRVLTEAMKKLSAMKNPMSEQALKDFINMPCRPITVERVYGNSHSEGHSVRVMQTRSNSLERIFNGLYEDSHGHGRFAHLYVYVKNIHEQSL